MKVSQFSGLLTCLLCACSTSTPPAHAPASEAPPANEAPAAGEGPTDESAHEAGPVGTKLVRDVVESPEKFEVSEAQSGGLGGFALHLNGAPLWPPTGDGCEKLVACCNSLAALAKPLALSCLMAIARDKTCRAALSTSVAVAKEQSYPLPASCAR
jgi:hypothetical protein